MSGKEGGGGGGLQAAACALAWHAGGWVEGGAVGELSEEALEEKEAVWCYWIHVSSMGLVLFLISLLILPTAHALHRTKLRLFVLCLLGRLLVFCLSGRG